MQATLSEKLSTWFYQNKRDLPWRKDKSFYRVWISEVMLQQTQVKTVIPYFLRFMKKYPTITSFALAEEQDLLKIWQGLGYYNRIKNAQKAAKYIVDQCSGVPPTDYDSLIKLPGFGPYICSAVLSFYDRQKLAVVDGNVIRLLSRLFARQEDFRKSRNRKIIQSIADKLIPSTNPDVFNEAMMEFGALICTPKKPKCAICPLSVDCLANKTNQVQKLPFLSKRKTVPKKKKYVLIIRSKNQFLFQQRKSTEMLGSLWEFPTQNFTSKKNIDNEIMSYFNISNNIKQIGSIKHSYSHFQLELVILYFKLNSRIEDKNMKWMGLDSFKKLPSHGANDKVLKLFINFMNE